MTRCELSVWSMGRIPWTTRTRTTPQTARAKTVAHCQHSGTYKHVDQSCAWQGVVQCTHLEETRDEGGAALVPVHAGHDASDLEVRAAGVIRDSLKQEENVLLLSVCPTGSFSPVSLPHEPQIPTRPKL